MAHVYSMQSACSILRNPPCKRLTNGDGQADDSMALPPVTFGLHGKAIRINDMRVGGEGVALACEAISQVALTCGCCLTYDSQ